MQQADSQKKSFFERMGEILNAPLPGTEAGTEATTKPATQKKADSNGIELDDGSLLAEDSLLQRIKDILNTPLPGSDALNKQTYPTSLEDLKLEITEEDFSENWWDTEWEAFKAHQAQDRKGLNMKQRQDQEWFAQYQEQERFQFEMYQMQEFDIFQSQQQAKMNWVLEAQVASPAGEQSVQYGIVPPPAPVMPLPPQMPIPPWMKVPDDKSNIA